MSLLLSYWLCLLEIKAGCETTWASETPYFVLIKCYIQVVMQLWKDSRSSYLISPSCCSWREHLKAPNAGLVRKLLGFFRRMESDLGTSTFYKTMTFGKLQRWETLFLKAAWKYNFQFCTKCMHIQGSLWAFFMYEAAESLSPQLQYMKALLKAEQIWWPEQLEEYVIQRYYTSFIDQSNRGRTPKHNTDVNLDYIFCRLIRIGQHIHSCMWRGNLWGAVTFWRKWTHRMSWQAC